MTLQPVWSYREFLLTLYVMVLLAILLILLVAPAAIAGVTVGYPAGYGEPMVAVESEPASGLDGGIFVAPAIDGLRISFDDPQARWSIFDSRGAAYAESVTPSGSDASSSWIDSPRGDLGYAVESAGRTVYFWLVDYSAHTFIPGDLTIVAESGDCSRASVLSSGSGDDITVYGITGRRFVVDRQIQLSYNTLAWDEGASAFRETELVETYPSLRGSMSVAAPLCQTSFHLTGDRFLKAWGREESATSPVCGPYAIDCHTTATQHTDDSDNSNEVVDVTSGDLGGSAPSVVTFTAEVTDGVIFHEWQFSRSESFEDIYLRVQDLEVTHTFEDAGTEFVRLHCADASGECDLYSTVYIVSIGNSMLKCPNAFTPFNRDGVNDEWRVTYSSLVSFECHIFNRNGHKIATLTHPSQGWDGRYGGKDVPAGVYYYVIKARGSDGRDYNLSGDINILNYK